MQSVGRCGPGQGGLQSAVSTFHMTKTQSALSCLRLFVSSCCYCCCCCCWATYLNFTWGTPPPPRYYCARQVEQQGKGGAECTLRQLRVTCTTTGSTHTLSHHHFHAWPDHGTPSSSSGIRAICRELAPARASGHPILVHCSAVSVCQQRVVDALQLLKHWPGTSNNLVL
jgi:hypothetical protein